MAKKKKKTTSRKTTVPVAVIAGFGPLAANAIDDFQKGGLKLLSKGLSRNVTGYNPDTQSWSLTYMWRGTIPVLIGTAVHWLASKLGVNRALGRARIPLLRV